MRADSAASPALGEELRAERAAKLRAILEAAARRYSAECILLSGGLDTSVVAQLARPHRLRAAVTVLVGPDAPDGPYAAAVAQRLGLDHHVVRTDFEGLLGEAAFVVGTLVTFDPMEVRNSLVIARGLREVTRLGFSEVVTGDGADELFAGYSYMWSKPPGDFERYCAYLARVMRFSSIPLGAALGIRAQTPFLDPEVVAFALALSKDDKVGFHDGVTFGKYLLRLAFPGLETIWRRKDPIEVGSGSTRLTEYFRERIPAGEFERERDRIARGDRIEIRDPEHLAYFRIFREVFGDAPPRPRFAEDPCAKCGFELPSRESMFCVTCGAWPAR